MTTIISCPQCGAAYDIPDASNVRGRKVRCTGCSTVWRVQGDTFATQPESAPPPLREFSDSPATVRLTRSVIGPEHDKAEAIASSTVTQTGAQPGPQPSVPVVAARSWQDDLISPAGKPSGPLTDIHDGTRTATNGTGGTPISQSIERRRQARRSSGFDEVEAALAAIQAGPAAKTPNLPQDQFFDASRNSRLAASARAASVARFDPLIESEGLDGGGFVQGSQDGTGRRKSRTPVVLGWLLFASALAGLTAFSFLNRQSIVRMLPGTAKIYASLGAPVNVRGLEFTGVDTQWQLDPNGHPVLSITGQIRNVSKQPQTVPSVVFAFHDEAGQELFEWATAVRINALEPGATAPFTDVVLAPADAVRNVEIRFAKLRR